MQQIGRHMNMTGKFDGNLIWQIAPFDSVPKILRILFCSLYNRMMYELACVMSRHAHAELQTDIRHTCVSKSSPLSVCCSTIAIRAGADN